MGTYLLWCSHWRGNVLLPTTLFKMFWFPLPKMLGFMFHIINTCPPINLFLIFTSANRYCRNFKWGSHVWSCWYHLNIFKFVNYHFLRNGYNNCGLCKGRIIVRATFSKVFSLLPQRYLGAHTNMLMIFFIDVLTWDG